MNVLPLHNPEQALPAPAVFPGVRLAVIIPCYRVASHAARVIEEIGPEVTQIICVDDRCPEGSGARIENRCGDPRVTVLYHESNRGVGGAMITGYRRALADGADVIVKIDGDGQMDPSMIERFVRPIVLGRADYTKGNRFFNLKSLKDMPAVRLLGNAALSFLTKLSSGYWGLMDPTNGYVAIHRRVLEQLPLDKISERYFFESDMLFRLNTVGAVVEEVPMDARYDHLESSLKVGRVWLPFLIKNTTNALKRLFYNHFLRDFSVASVELVLGGSLMLFGVLFGLNRWWESLTSGTPVTAGTVMLAGLPVIVASQLLMSFLAYDMRKTPSTPLHKRL